MKTILSLLFLCALHYCNAQNPEAKRAWHWYFGNGAGIDFSSGTAVADTNGQLYTNEGCAAISDLDGNLLFYSDGRTVWNHLHAVMPNGTGIMGGANGSSTQEALIIPKPLSPNIYYLFTTDEAENYGANGMRYSVVDMNLDGGNGDIVSDQKNILLFAPCTEKLAAVNHCNDTSVWVMGHEVNNNHFRAYLVTANGIDTSAVVSAMGHNMKHDGGMQGCMKFSPNGKKLCFASDSFLRRVELADFDNYSGSLSNSFTIKLNSYFTVPIAFSNDNTKLYFNDANGKLVQYDISSNDSSTIVLSETLILPNLVEPVIGAQNASDEKIYLLHYSQSNSSLSIINSPNNLGVSCFFIPYSLDAMTAPLGNCLPNFNSSYFNQSPDKGCFTGTSEINSDVIKIFPNPAKDWIEIKGREIQEVQLIDVFGNLCINEREKNTSSITINTSALPRGIYLLRVIADAKMISQKVILQ